MKFKKSLGLADKLGARYALIIGEDEVASGTYTLKRLADAEQKKLTEANCWSIWLAGRRGFSLRGNTGTTKGRKTWPICLTLLEI